MPARAWQSVFSARSGISENIFDPAYQGLFTFLHLDLDDIETPWHVARAKPAQPLVRSAPDQKLFLAVHRREAADHRVLLPGFHLDEKELSALTRDDIDLPSPPAFEIPGQHLAIPRPQPVGCDFLTVVAGPFARATSTRPRAVGRVEIPAETTDDDGDKAHVF